MLYLYLHVVLKLISQFRSFPDISDYFHISDGLTQMTIAVNFSGFVYQVLLMVLYQIIYGRRNVMLIGNAIMLIGAVLCVVAHNIELLLIARFIQGFGASTSAVVVFCDDCRCL